MFDAIGALIRSRIRRSRIGCLEHPRITHSLGRSSFLWLRCEWANGRSDGAGAVDARWFCAFSAGRYSWLETH